MTDTKMLQAIIAGQKALEERLGVKIEKEIKGVRKDVQEVKVQVIKNGKRLDRIGLQLARLEDDAPTIEEFDNLEKRVTKIAAQVIKS